MKLDSDLLLLAVHHISIFVVDLFDILYELCQRRFEVCENPYSLFSLAIAGDLHPCIDMIARHNECTHHQTLTTHEQLLSILRT